MLTRRTPVGEYRTFVHMRKYGSNINTDLNVAPSCAQGGTARHEQRNRSNVTEAKRVGHERRVEG